MLNKMLDKMLDKMLLINKPKFDLRTFKGGQLSNGIKYVLINDTSLEKSYVSVCIKIGSYANPKDFGGLAHFLEHMLFMGSKKYPDENHYSQRLNELGGYSNAYTDVTETVYYFNVFDNGLAEIIDIFSRFFIDPLFDPDSVKREINAVNSEHQKNINNDGWKKFQFMIDITNKDSGINEFMTGSTSTLSKPNIRDKVIEFYKKYYTTDNISITIGSAKPITELEQIIIDTFQIIKKTTSHGFTIIKPFYSENIEKTFYIKSITNTYKLTLLWEIPQQESYSDTKDYTILEMILSNRSENSLYFYLKNLGWLKALNIEIKHEGVFIIDLILTKEGFNNIKIIDSILFSCLDKIFNSNLRKYAEYYSQVAAINFDCLNKLSMDDLCNLLSVNHHYYPTINVFDKKFKFFKLKTTQQYRNEFIQYITKTNLIRIIQSQTLTIDTFDITKYKLLKSREYLTEYMDITDLIKFNISKYDVNKTLGCIDLINNYLSVKPHVVDRLDKYKIPKLIKKNQWYGGCSKFGEPLIYLWMCFNNNTYFSSPTNYILTKISCSILNFMISSFMSKPLDICYFIYFEPKPTTSSINIHIKALNDFEKLKLLLDELFIFIHNIDSLINKISDEYMHNLIVSIKESYLNINFLNPWEYTMNLVGSMSFNTEYTSDTLLKYIDLISINNIKTYLINLFTTISPLTTLVYGNIESIYLSKLFNKFKDYFNIQHHHLPEINDIRSITKIHPNIKETSSCVSYYYPVGEFTPKKLILLNLITSILGQPFFELLRTKYQLGYLVRMSIQSIKNNYWIVQRVQSDKKTSLVEDKINHFNESMIKIINKAKFEEFIQTLKKELEEADYSLSEQYNRYLPEISSREFIFNRNKLLVKQLNKVDKKELIAFVKQNINSLNRKIVIINGN